MVPEVKDVEAIRSGGTRVTTIPDGPSDYERSEGVEIVVEGMRSCDGAA